METDVKIATTHRLRCFICDGREIDKKSLSKVTEKGYSQLASCTEQVRDASLRERLQEDWNDGNNPRLRYHMDCRTELINHVRRKSTVADGGNYLLFSFYTCMPSMNHIKNVMLEIIIDEKKTDFLHNAFCRRGRAEEMV